LEHRIGIGGFRLQCMEDIYVQSEGKVDTAHRHDYYTLLLVYKATGYHLIDYNKYAFGRLEVHFVSPGQVHQVALEQEPEGFVITFSKDFLVQNNIPEQFISNINLFQTFGHTPPLQLDRITYKKLVAIISEMEDCMIEGLAYGQRALGALLQMFLIYCNNSSKFDATQINEDNTAICIFRDFKGLIEDRFKEWHMVKEYAQEINISPKHLSQTVKDVTGKVAKVHIQDRLILEAKRLLLHTTQSVKEVGYAIGFEEPLHFSGFFKRQTGMSPSFFRQAGIT